MKFETTFDWNENRYELKTDYRFDPKEFLEFSNVSATLFTTTTGQEPTVQEVGTLVGTILPRPSSYSFHEQADAVSAELQRLACAFCDKRGTANRIPHEKLQHDRKAQQRGGFFHLDILEINPSHKGQLLGLCMLHYCLVQLKDHFTLVVTLPGALNKSYCKWTHDHHAAVPQESTERDAIMLKIRRHFVRFGFFQAGEGKLCQMFFLTKASYFEEKDPKTVSPSSRWLSKESAAQISLAAQPSMHEPMGLDKSLNNLVQSLVGDCTTFFQHLQPFLTRKRQNHFQQVTQLIEQGASVDRSRALFVAAVSGDEELCDFLIREGGGNVNFQDEFGCTPLHMAACHVHNQAIQILVANGADLTLVNNEGKTALACFQDGVVDLRDMRSVFGLGGMAPRAEDIGLRQKSILWLIPAQIRAQLVDNWLSPRMMKCLETTVNIKRNLQKTQPGETFRRSKAYLPPEIVRVGSEQVRRGWHRVWAVMSKLLIDQHPPTVNNVKRLALDEQFLCDISVQDFRVFTQQGGKVDHAVDALVSKTKTSIMSNKDTFQAEMNGLSETLLDKEFDLARYQCITVGGGDLPSRGPQI